MPQDALERSHDARSALDPFALTALRVISGLVVAAHGWQKVTGFDGWVSQVGALGVPAPDITAVLAIVAELGGGILLALGMATPVAALLILIDMIVAIAVVHAPHGLFAQAGGFEYPLLIALVALYFFAHGPGPFSVDGMVRRARPGARRAHVGPIEA